MDLAGMVMQLETKSGALDLPAIFAVREADAHMHLMCEATGSGVGSGKGHSPSENCALIRCYVALSLWIYPLTTVGGPPRCF